MNIITGPVVYTLAALCLLLGIAAGVQSFRLSNERAAHATDRANHAQVLRGIADSAAAVARKARQTAEEFAAAHSTNEQIYQKGKEDGKAAQSAVVAGLLDGTVRLQQHWEARAATAALTGEVVAAAEGADAGAQLRAESAGRIIGYADQCDNDIGWFQRELIATRTVAEACGASDQSAAKQP